MHANILMESKQNEQHRYYYKNSWLQLIRPMTLTGIISPILVGTGLAFLNGHFQMNLLFALFISALLIQSATNVLNDYYDFKYGQDKEKWAKQNDASSHGPSHETLPYIASGMLIVATIFGLYLAFSSTLWVILIGILGIFAGFRYSAGKKSFSSIGMGEFIAAIFLGPVVTILAYLVQTQTINSTVIIVSLLFSMLIASMILTNNIRDLKKDIGFRKTLAYRLGRKQAVRLLITILILPYVTVIPLVTFQVLHLSSLMSLLALPFAIRLIWSFRKGASRQEEIDGMKWAARHHWAFGMLFAISLRLF